MLFRSRPLSSELVRLKVHTLRMFETNRFIRLSFVALVNAALFFCSNCIAEDRAALLIGNESYAISPLRTPLNDVRAIGQALRRAGFSVVTVENATQKDFYERVDRFFTEHSTASVQLFFYAGHAIQLNGRNYLVPIEATLDSSDILAKMFDLRHLLERLENPRVNTRFVILDACRNNPFSGHPGASSGLSELIAPSNTYVAFSTTPGAVAFDGEGDNSPYTVSLLSY